MARRTPAEFEITINNLVYGGEGLGFFENKPVFVFGVLPGEKILVRPIKVRGKFIKAALVKILEPSSQRIEPRNSHYITSSPWEIFPAVEQREQKKLITINMWSKIAKTLPAASLNIDSSFSDWNYRNKLEFSFVETEQGVSLAFHQRYYYNRFYSLKNSALAPEKINDCAEKIVSEINRRNLKTNNLKNLLLRYSFKDDCCIGVLYVTSEKFSVFEISHPSLQGWQIVYSNPKSPAAITDKVLLSSGDLSLREEIAGNLFRYGYDNFFQVNPRTFDKIIKFIKNNLKKDNILLDLYSGVGTVGMSLSDFFNKIICIEYDSTAKKFANENATSNNLKNVEIISGQAEKQDLNNFFKHADCLVVDPPRSGLHPKVVKEIILNPPKKFVYISCNPATQARDWVDLKSVYETFDWRLFDMYPQTPHIESVLIMTRRKDL